MQDSSTSKTEVVLAIFYVKSPSGSIEVFLQNRFLHQDSLLWEFPGGKIEKNETAENALVREIKEEIDFDMNPKDLVFLTAYPVQFGEKSVNLNVYTVPLAKKFSLQTPRLILWANLNQMHQESFPLIAGSKPLIAELNHYFGKI